MKLVQLNIERDNHLERVLPFLEREQADVICLQEVFEEDLALFHGALGMESVFAPVTRTKRMRPPHTLATQGVAILTRTQPTSSHSTYYRGGNGAVPRHVDGTVREGAEQYTVGTTHFMKSWHGAPDDYQRAHLPRLLEALNRYEELVFAGDFNIPRDTELYRVLSEHYCDHVPCTYVSSLDPELHRVPGLRYLIDYIWSTNGHVVNNVRMTCGVSDHCALSGTVMHA